MKKRSNNNNNNKKQDYPERHTLQPTSHWLSKRPKRRSAKYSVRRCFLMHVQSERLFLKKYLQSAAAGALSIDLIRSILLISKSNLNHINT